MSLEIDHMPDIGITRVSRWIWNCYVLHGGEAGPVVVDAGLPHIADDLAPLLEDLPGTVQAIVATHAHSDHVAGAPELAARHGAGIHLPGAALGYLDGQQPRTPTLRKTAPIWPVLVDQPFDARAAAGLVRGSRIAGFGGPGGMRWTGPDPVGGLTDAQSLPGAPDWTVVEAPGHTDDSVALWHAPSGTLLAGDAVLTARGRAWHTPETVDTERARRTAARLEQLPVAHLLPGHGLPVHAANVWEGQRREGGQDRHPRESS